MSEFAVPLAVAGSQAAPSAVLPLTLPTANGTRWHDGISQTVINVPGLRGLAIANGHDPVRLVAKRRAGPDLSTVYDCGGLAPKTAPAGTQGVQASTRLDTDNGGAYVIANGDYVELTGTGLCGCPTLGRRS